MFKVIKEFKLACLKVDLHIAASVGQHDNTYPTAEAVHWRIGLIENTAGNHE